jgi:hypothetical protein
MNRRYILPFTVALLAVQPQAAWSQNYPQQAEIAAPAYQQQRAWLGVYLKPVPDVLASQLAGLMSDGQGLLVSDIKKGSPADIAGIQSHDILLKLDDQKLFSPAQLTSLVRSSESGSQVNLQLIRAGKVQTVKVDLAPRPGIGTRRPAPPYRHPYAQQQMPQPAFPEVPVQPDAPLAWDSFESVEVKTLEDGRYHASVSYKNESNEVKSYTFEGKKDEIIAQINQQGDLPQEKKAALLDALNMNKGDFMRPFRSPFMHGNPFSDPFFSINPFDDSFFRDPFFYGYPHMNRHPFFNRYQQPHQPPAQPNWQNR